MILGIDVGGTTVKFGLVDTKGNITDKKRYNTKEWEAAGFLDCLHKAIEDYTAQYPELTKVGIGFPGLLSSNRQDVVRMANIKSVENAPVVSFLKEKMPTIEVKIENDAKCAALGEMHFGDEKFLDNFILITLGTGVGSGAVINKQLFLGAHGNGMEVGHMVIDKGVTLEQRLGLNQISQYAQKQLDNDTSIESKLRGIEISPKDIFEAAREGDAFALDIFNYVGEQLGLGIVSIIRVLDLNNIILGGGVSGAFEFFVPKTIETIKAYLPPYYTDTLKIEKATVQEDAGILGAASLQIESYQTVGNVLA